MEWIPTEQAEGATGGSTMKDAVLGPAWNEGPGCDVKGDQGQHGTQVPACGVKGVYLLYFNSSKCILSFGQFKSWVYCTWRHLLFVFSLLENCFSQSAAQVLSETPVFLLCIYPILQTSSLTVLSFRAPYIPLHHCLHVAPHTAVRCC